MPHANKRGRQRKPLAQGRRRQSDLSRTSPTRTFRRVDEMAALLASRHWHRFTGFALQTTLLASLVVMARA